MRRAYQSRLAVSLLSALAATRILPSFAGDSASFATSRQPVLDLDFADPFIMRQADSLIAYATNTLRDGKALNVQISRSLDGLHWSVPSEAMPLRPRWAREHQPDIWAPAVLPIEDHYVLYFSARHATLSLPDGLTLCVGAAVAGQPEGPFVPLPEPLTCGGLLGAIDASPFRDGANLWLYIKTDGNCCGMPTNVIAQRLSPDGLELAGSPMKLAGLTDGSTWEGNIIEAPEMRRHDDDLLLFFSGNVYSGSRYAVGYARCASPAGPCVQGTDNPILQSRDGFVGPGGESVFDYRGRTWIAFAAWREAWPRYRAMYLVTLTWVDGRPVIR